MKTPEQIAQAVQDNHDFAAISDLKSPEQVFDMITEAIEADRAQRTQPDDTAHKALELLEKASKLGLTFDIGSAYISRAYIDKQAELLAQIKELQED